MPMRNDVAEILSRFPGPVTLHPSRTKWLLVFAGGALFATGGGLMVADGKGTGWFVLIFFVLVALAGAAALLPGAGGLTLDREEFAVTNLFRRLPPCAGGTFNGLEGRAHPARAAEIRNEFRHQAKQTTALAKRTNVAIAGHNSSLPDTY